jgi:hypothetical protein
MSRRRQSVHGSVSSEVLAATFPSILQVRVNFLLRRHRGHATVNYFLPPAANHSFDGACNLPGASSTAMRDRPRGSGVQFKICHRGRAVDIRTIRNVTAVFRTEVDINRLGGQANIWHCC